MPLVDIDLAIDTAIDAADEWDCDFSFERDRKIRDAFMALPTVDAVPVVHGRWQYHINANNEVNTKDAYCSKCGFYVDVTTTFNFNKYLHCPNCGAVMN